MKKLMLMDRKVRFAALLADSAGRPVSGATEAHLAAINALPMVLTPLTAADVYVRQCEAINDLPLKNGLILGLPELGQIAMLSPGKGIHRNHDTYTAEGGLPIGRIFAARLASAPVPAGVTQVQPHSVAMLAESVPGNYTQCVQTFYILATDEGTELVRLIDGGAIAEVSVSFMYDQLTCSICNTDLQDCAHWPLEMYDGQTCMGLVQGVNDYLETSLVWQGMANETRLKMAAACGALCADADLAALFAAKPRPGALDALFIAPSLDPLFEVKPLEGLFTQ